MVAFSIVLSLFFVFVFVDVVVFVLLFGFVCFLFFSSFHIKAFVPLLVIFFFSSSSLEMFHCTILGTPIKNAWDSNPFSQRHTILTRAWVGHTRPPHSLYMGLPGVSTLSQQPNHHHLFFKCPSLSNPQFFLLFFFNHSFGVPELLLLSFYVFVQCQKSRKTINVSFLLCRIFYTVISLLSILKPPLTVFPLSQAPCYKLRIGFVHKRWKYWRLQRFSVKGNS